MRGGNNFRVVLLMLVVVAVTLGGARLLRTMDTRQSYVAAAAQLERSDTDQRDAYMRCVLPTYQRSQLGMPSALRSEVARVTERMGKGYGEVLASCAPLLAAFQYTVREVRAPADMHANLTSVAAAADELGAGFRALEELLQRPGATYDHNGATREIDRIGAAWHSYLGARDRAKRALADRM